MGVGTAIFLGLVQGVAELFPLSSLGLLVILPHLSHLAVPTTGAKYLPFLTALHLGTGLALLIYFLKDWYQLLREGLWSLLGKPSSTGRLFWMVLWASIPAGVVGLVLKNPLSHLFGKPMWVAVFLIVNGFIMMIGDRWHQRRAADRTLEALQPKDAVRIGLFQVLALVPGLSRSGSTMTGGLGEGLSYQEAARFSFLMATPIILAAALVELPHLHAGAHSLLLPALIGGITAGCAAWLSTRFLMRYFQNHRLRAFALISMALGVFSLVIMH
ncbi:MAG: undecaprenyl-diphosphatase [Sulfobacillus acidophilus]|uniref:Undecaprenyl-diphosphatase n=1 Tax=Sulfobacillus acidophilus TaxID=53633 RepID=A0A2T2WCS5_9FIRM|nr:MAG: undecaprenyl-diphosphatase [Sulfobacillus acidophilus]